MKKLACALFLLNIFAVMLYAQSAAPQAYFTEPSFAPDKAEIAFVSGGDIWSVPARSALGQRALERPTILITNQHSLSDAEDFSEGYRALKLGKIVGEPTAGWIIYTWNTTLYDGTTLRLPRQLVTGSDGQNMELNPRPVDIPVTRPIGESLSGKDSQLDKAVSELLGQIKR